MFQGFEICVKYQAGYFGTKSCLVSDNSIEFQHEFIFSKTEGWERDFCLRSKTSNNNLEILSSENQNFFHNLYGGKPDLT